VSMTGAGGFGGLVQARDCLGNTLCTRPGDHTSPKRKRG
jgi:hypothetical protein